MNGWVKVNKAAEYSGVSVRTLRSWLKSGLRHSRLNTGTILIKITWIDEYLKQFESCENIAESLVNEALKDLQRGE